MSASKLNPRTWNGEVRGGGNLNKNTTGKSAQAPDYKGPVYIEDHGWFWESLWFKRGKNGEFLSVSHRPMTDEEVLKYCKPKPDSGRQTGQTSHRPIPAGAQNGADNTDGDIPF
jgi:hypothetical protein